MISLVDAYGLSFLVPDNDTAVGACLRDYGEFARPEFEFIGAHDFSTMFDVGANIGAISIPLAATLPDRNFFAFEPQPAIFDLLSKNISNNGLSNIRAVHGAVGERPGRIHVPTVSLSEAGNYGAASLYDKDRPQELVPLHALDDFRSCEPRFLKIDVEGFEPRVLEGAQQLLRTLRPDMLVEVSPHRPKTAELVFAALRRHYDNLYWFFSPFVTRRRTRNTDTEPKLRGDLAIYASVREPPWELAKMSQDWPKEVREFPYLKPYGLINEGT